MVRHNNVVPNAHFHKKWATSTRGPLKVVTWFDQAANKKQRRLRRAAKAAKLAPRPLARLRPVVVCPTQRYAGKRRLGRGFTLEELKAAGLAPGFALTVGIAVDHRRVNKCTESLDRNVLEGARRPEKASTRRLLLQRIVAKFEGRVALVTPNTQVARLEEYKAKLVLFPRKGAKAKAGDATPEQMAAATQYAGRTMLPLDAPEAAEEVEFVEVTEEMKEAKAYAAHREARNELKLKGIRVKMAKAKAEAK